MATLTMSGKTLNFDSPELLSFVHGDTIQVNGGDLTFDSDNRWSQNAGVLGIVQCTSTLPANVRFDATKTWEIPYGTGNRVYEATSLLLGFDTDFVDESKTVKAVTVFGTPSIVLPGFNGVGEGRASFNGTTDYLKYTYTGTDFDFSTNNFAVAFNLESNNYATTQTILSINTNAAGYASLKISIEAGKLRVQSSSDGTTWGLDKTITTSLGTGTINTNNIIISRDGGTVRTWFNSVRVDTTAFASSIMANTGVETHWIGSGLNGANKLNGFLDEVCIMKGINYDLNSDSNIDLRMSKFTRSVPMIYDATGVVPTLGTLGTNTVTGLTSGATGELLGLFSTDRRFDVPLSQVSGQSLNHSGLLKLRYKTGNFIPGETISLPGGGTIKAASAGKRSWLNIVGLETKNVVGFRQNKFIFTGDWYDLGVTDGKYNQTFQFPVKDACGAIQIETAPGSGIYEWYLNAGNRWDWYSAGLQFIGNDVRGKFFGQSPGVYTNSTLQISGARTGVFYSYKPPAGCKVRVPNLILSSTTAADYNANTLSSTLASRYDFSLTSDGNCYMDKVCSNWYMYFGAAHEINILNTCTIHQFQLYNPTKIPIIDNIAVGLYGSLDSLAFYIILNRYDIVINKVRAVKYKIDSGSSGSNSSCASFIEFSKIILNDCEFSVFGNTTDTNRGSNSAGPIYVARYTEFTVNNLKIAGGYIYTAQGLSFSINNVQYADLICGETTSVNTTNVIYGGLGIYKVRIDGISSYGNIPNVHPYSGLFLFNSLTKDLIIKNIGTPESPYHGGTNNTTSMGYIISPSYMSYAILYKVYCISLRNTSNQIGVSNTIVGFNLVNVWADNTCTQAIMANECIIKGCKWTPSMAVQASVYGFHFEDSLPNDTERHLKVAFNEPTPNTVNQLQVRGWGQESVLPRLSGIFKDPAITLNEEQRAFVSSSVGYVMSEYGTLAQKWSVEVTVNSIGTMAAIGVGQFGCTDTGVGTFAIAYLSTGQVMINNVTSAYGATYVAGDVIEVLINGVDKQVSFSKNGVNQGVAYSGFTTMLYVFAGKPLETAKYSFNFGQSPRAYAVTAGYSATLGHTPAFFNGGGYGVFDSLGCEIIAECPFFMIGCYALKAEDPTMVLNEPNNIQEEFQYDLGSGYNGTWLLANAANLGSVNNINPNIGIRLKFRFRPLVPNSIYNGIAFFKIIALCTAEQQKMLYPEPTTLYEGTITGCTIGSRIRIFNVTKNKELANAISTSSSFSLFYYDVTDIAENDVLLIKATYVNGSVAKLPSEATLVAPTGNWKVIIDQDDDVVYNTNALSGSTMSEFNFNHTTSVLEISAPSKASTAQRLYAYMAYLQHTETGIKTLFESIKATDAITYVMYPSVLSWKLKNMLSTSVRISGGYLYRYDNTGYIDDTSGSIFLDPGKAYAVETGVSGLTSTESTLLSSIGGKASQASIDNISKQMKNTLAIVAGNSL